jgi:hypothetical protein
VSKGRRNRQRRNADDGAHIHALWHGGSGTATACPDCASTPVGNALQHAPTCPIAVGVDAATDDDREFFEHHHEIRTRRRRMTHAERLALIQSDPQLADVPEANLWCDVVNIRPGFRLRQPIVITPSAER